MMVNFSKLNVLREQQNQALGLPFSLAIWFTTEAVQSARSACLFPKQEQTKSESD